ncbi:hypothetical protein [Rhizobium sp. BK650]|uniref:hypothetical protein n=1 Tax=Rhizobium sp. BK650 TaxID=2586990 RepID=UPI0016110506
MNSQRLGRGPTGAVELVLAHIEEALNEDDTSTQKAAFLIAALVHSPEKLKSLRRFYSELLATLRSGEMVEVRQELLAVEGVFLLRALGLAQVSQEELKSVLVHPRDRILAIVDMSGRRPLRETKSQE